MTIAKFKTKNLIYQEFVTVVKEGLTFFNQINFWKIRQLRQVLKINVLEPTCYLQIISNNQLGQQYGRKYRNNEGLFITENCTKQEVKIRFSASKRRLESDGVDTLSGVDILKLIKDFIQSEIGIKTLAQFGYAQYRATEIVDQEFINDDEDFQFLPYFDCVFLYTDIWTNEIHKIDKVLGNIHKI